jgi:hypothetical protein
LKTNGLGQIALQTKGISPSKKVPIGKTIQTFVWHEPHAQEFTPHHIKCTHDSDWFHLGNTLELGFIDPIGHLETLSKPKFEKLYNIFEHLFGLGGLNAHVQVF